MRDNLTRAERRIYNDGFRDGYREGYDNGYLRGFEGGDYRSVSVVLWTDAETRETTLDSIYVLYADAVRYVRNELQGKSTGFAEWVDPNGNKITIYTDEVNCG